MEEEVTTSLLSPVKVLLIDDDAFNREGVRLYLSQKGFHVLEASDVATARRTVAEYRPDVLVVDIVIPPRTNSRFQMSQSAGIQLASQLKHTYFISSPGAGTQITGWLPHRLVPAAFLSCRFFEGGYCATSSISSAAQR